MYKVWYTTTKFRDFQKLEEALMYAEEAVHHFSPVHFIVSIQDWCGTVIAVAIEDSSGVSVHRLYPGKYVPADVAAAWEKFHEQKRA